MVLGGSMSIIGDTTGERPERTLILNGRVVWGSDNLRLLRQTAGPSTAHLAMRLQDAPLRMTIFGVFRLGSFEENRQIQKHRLKHSLNGNRGLDCPLF